jgi:hypothetical protein
MGLFDKMTAARGPQKEKRISKCAQRILALHREDHKPLDTTPWELPNCSIDLRQIQRKALEAIRANGGAFLPVGVGWGKTYISILAPMVRQKRHAIIVAPSATIPHIRESITLLELGFKLNTTYSIMSYGEISKTSSSGILEDVAYGFDPSVTMLICDEAHLLKRPESARTKRVIRFLKGNPEIEVVMMSGTMTNRSLKDYSHLIAMCLRENTPLPLERRTLQSWCEVIDVEGRCEQHFMIDVADVLKAYDSTISSHDIPATRKKKARKAFAQHLRGASGVVGTKASALGTSLLIHQINKREVAGYSDDLKEVYKLVQETGESPDGEVTYESAADVARTLKQLSLGFFYSWEWPNGEIDLKWMEARSNWNRLVRHELASNAREGYDSPALIDGHCSINRHKNLSELQKAWSMWQQHKHKPAPPVKTNWIDTNVIRKAYEFACENRLPLWYQSKAVADMLEQLGCFVYRSGDEIDTNNLPDVAAFSISAHGTGLNLQQYDKAVIIEPPGSGLRWEQLLGRLHRPGQLADEVNFYVLSHTPQLRRSFVNALEDSRYIQDSTQQPQKLTFAVKTKG